MRLLLTLLLAAAAFGVDRYAKRPDEPSSDNNKESKNTK